MRRPDLLARHIRAATPSDRWPLRLAWAAQAIAALLAWALFIAIAIYAPEFVP